MKKSILSVLVAVLLAGGLKAQLFGTYNVPGTFPTLAAAITSLNASGVGGPITINVAAGYVETAPAGGYSLGVLAGASSINTVTIRKSGIGANPVLSAYVGTATPSSAAQDGVFKFVGSDWVTIDGIDITDGNNSNPANMEFGYGFFKASATDGCQNNTIRNCVITLKTGNNAAGSGPATDGSRGIDMVNALVGAHTTAVTITSANGSHSNNKFYSNVIQNCNVGISMVGFAAPSPFTLADSGNDVGGSSAATSNTVINFGGGGTTSGATGINATAQHSVNISNNIINNNTGSGTNHNQTLRGIVLNSANTAQGVISNNTITLKSAGSTQQLAAISNAAGSSTSNTLTITGNLITGCSFTTATTGVFNAIVNTGTPSDLIVNSNTVSAITHTGTATDVIIETGGAVSAITNSNVVTTYTRSGASGAVRVLKTTSTTNWTASGNTVDGIIWTTNSTGSISAIYDAGTGVNITVSNNVVRNMALPGNGMLEGIRMAGSAGNKIISGNQVYSFSTTAGGTVESTFIGIASSVGTATITGNVVYSLAVTGGTTSTVNGILIAGGTTNLVFKNKIFDIGSTSTTPTIALINVTGGTNNGIFNNVVGSALVGASNGTNAVIGINLNGGTTNSVYFNSVNLSATSTGTNFGSSALYALTTSSLDLRNNILVNTSSANGTALAVAFRRSSSTLTTYSATSNNNLYYAGTPASNRLLFADGTNAISLLTPLKVLMVTRDQTAVTENPPFATTVGANVNFLNINTAVATQVESGALPVAGITDDYAGTVRNATTPDIGAWEGGFTPKTTCAGAPATSTAVATVTTICTVVPFNLYTNTTFTETGLTYQWLASTTGSNGTYNAISNATNVLLSNPTPTALTTWYQLQVTCPASSSVTLSSPVAVNLGPVPTATAAASSASVCYNNTVVLSGSTDVGTSFAWTGPGSYASAVQNPTITGPATGVYSLVVTAGTCTSAIATVTVTQLGKNFTNAILTNTTSVCQTTGTVALSFTLDPVNPTYSWSPGGNLSSTTASAITASLSATTVYSLDLSYQGCNQTKTIQINVGTPPAMVVAPLTNTICAGTTLTLTASGAATYSWSTNATASSIVVTPSVNGLNVYTVNGASVGCIVSQTVGITRNANPTVTITGPTGICAPDAATLTASGATSYSWNTGATTNSIVVSPVAPTQYTVTGTDANNCSNTVTRYLNVSTSLALNGSAPSTVCAGTTANIIINGADTYSWNTGATTNSITPSPTVTTTYSVFAAAGGCTGSVAVTVSVTPMPTLSLSGSTVICVGQTTTITATGATTYSWSTGATTNSLVLNPTVNTNYTITGANANCTNTQTLAVVANTVPVITITTPSTSVCFSTAVTLTANGANTYTWTNGPQTNTLALTPTSTAVYTVTGSSSAGCVATKTISQGVFALPNIVVTPASPTLCANALTGFTASGATTYTWNGGPVTGANATLSAASNTVFTVTGTNANNCVNTTSVTIITNSVPVVVALPATQTVCALTATTFTASGANSYVWSTGSTGSVGIGSSLNNTVFTVVGTNTTGCSASATVAITTLSLPVVSVNPPTLTACAFSANSFTASGADTYSWSTGATGSVAVVTPTNSTLFTVTGTDNNNCSSQFAVTVLTYSLPVISVTKPAATVCVNAAANYTAGGALTYTWSTNSNNTVTAITPSANGVFSVGGTNSNNCVGTTTFAINTFSLPVISVTPGVSQSVCVGASASFTSSGALTYTWTGGQQGNVFIATPSVSSTYTVNGKNQQGCIGTKTVNVALYPLTVVSVSATSQTVCAKESVTMTATGAQTYTWLPYNVVGSTYTLVPTATLKYTLVGTDVNGCTGQDTIKVVVDKCTGIAESKGSLGVSLYPNPTNGQFTIEMPFEGNKNITVVSSTGAMIMDKSTTEQSESVNLGDLARGMYFITVEAGGSVGHYRIVLQQ